jgi:hypothetical protein
MGLVILPLNHSGKSSSMKLRRVQEWKFEPPAARTDRDRLRERFDCHQRRDFTKPTTCTEPGTPLSCRTRNELQALSVSFCTAYHVVRNNANIVHASRLARGCTGYSVGITFRVVARVESAWIIVTKLVAEILGPCPRRRLQHLDAHSGRANPC